MKTSLGMLACLLCLGLTAAWAADDKPADIADVMTKGHKRGGFKDTIANELKKGSPDWMAAQEKAKEFVTLAEDLGKNKPPKGSEADWKKQCDSYVKIVKELAAACEKKNKAGANSAMQKLNKTCASCHNAHQDKGE